MLRADGSAAAIGAAKRRSILAALAIDLNRVVSADRLMDLAWEGAPPPTAKAALQGHVAQLRKSLGDGVELITRAPGYQLRAPRSAVDMTQFEDLVAAARDAPDAEAVELLDAALSLHRGPPLADVSAERLRREVVDRLDESMINAVHELAWRLHRIGRAAEGINPLREAVAMRPLREPLVELLVLSLHQAGRQAEALDVYHATRTRLAEELGVVPGPALQAAFHGVLSAAEESEPPSAPAQLPRESTGFVGRADELAQLDRTRGDGAVQILTGPAGVGKTALALRWAHRSAAQFPDGCLFSDLQGIADADPVEPGHVLGGFLRALGVAEARIPDNTDERAALYRSMLSSRRMLVVLDNARSAAQVRPLLPGAGCSVLVTSRSRLNGLAAMAGAVQIPVSPLSREAAVDVLRTVLGAKRIDTEPEAAAELAELCDRLPLALRIAAARAPNRTIRSLVAATANDRHRLDTLSLPDSGEGVRTALAASYRWLEPASARLFRLLGEHPGDSIDCLAAAALAGTAAHETQSQLEQLASVHLLQESGQGRYRWSDLVRLYAVGIGQEESVPERNAAFTRLLEHYMHIADRGLRFVVDSPWHRWVSPTPTELPEVRTAQAALSWFRAEETNLHRVLELAISRGEHARACHLALSLERFHHRLGDREAQTELSRRGLGIARELGDSRAQAIFSAHLCENLAS
ncbi:DNA-binding transcriptional activator of the SARP family [Saccharopolyspora kobensis]|uniref:DNA-binding transcriptional activator of the SARP family n=1 Tax=Saccharopolyspora kobensis TaxID=146035 RepID=A0A1H6EE80_9PSEU|nr:transcriptional regulator [Saccharopolyspora kobensis]SEG96072.1 DNA-binding transcriptional activator of the SARP family [Saccharopolyspora kobensis]SFD22510.1 DNA-binding transcriptional activator of the SARP family [Saccharopolyspora kobensis]